MKSRAILAAALALTLTPVTDASTQVRTFHRCSSTRIDGVKVFRQSTTATCATVRQVARGYLTASDKCGDRGCYLTPARTRWACLASYGAVGPRGSERLDVLCLTSPAHRSRIRFSYYNGGGD